MPMNLRLESDEDEEEEEEEEEALTLLLREALPPPLARTAREEGAGNRDADIAGENAIAFASVSLRVKTVNEFGEKKIRILYSIFLRDAGKEMTTTTTTTSSLSARVPSPRRRTMMMPPATTPMRTRSPSSRAEKKVLVVVRSGFFDEIMKAITPKNAEEIREEKALKRERLIASTPKGVMKSALRLLENTVIDGEELVVAYDAARDGWTASAFHERVDGKGPCLIVGKTGKGARFAAYNPLGFFSLEDYRDCPSAFLCVFKSEQSFLNGDASGMEILRNVGSPAIFDFGAQGPSFGPDGLRIPLGNAPANGSSYAGIGEATTNYGSSKKAISRLGSHYAGRSDGVTSVFAKGEKNETNLKELVALVSPSMERDGLYVS